MRGIHLMVALLLLFTLSAHADVNVGFSIGVNVPEYPQLVAVPGYPVYYDPDLDSNYFFYDGQYWVYVDDNWYASDWYNGPWMLVEPDYVPLFILRVPVRYYRRPPVYFHEWHPDGAPHWEARWGREWEENHRDWNRWDHRVVPRPAPLPSYQREYTGDRYPRRIEQQRSIRNQQYHYQPREPVTQHVSPLQSSRSGMVDQPRDQRFTSPSSQRAERHSEQRSDQHSEQHPEQHPEQHTRPSRPAPPTVTSPVVPNQSTESSRRSVAPPEHESRPEPRPIQPPRVEPERPALHDQHPPATPPRERQRPHKDHDDHG